MNTIIIKTGLWSAIICLTSLVVWIISFTAIALLSPLFLWTNITDYITYVNENPQFFQYLAKSFMIISSLSILVLFFIFNELIPIERRILSKIALALVAMFTLIASIHYWVQISAVRFALLENQVEGLEHFIQARPTSFLSSVNMLGWTLFLGLSSLFMYFATLPTSFTKTIRVGLLINSISCLMAGLGFIFQIDVITFVGINLGMGVALTIIAISSIKYFSLI